MSRPVHGYADGSRPQGGIEIPTDRQTVYDQWPQFEDFPVFMADVERVEQLDDQHLEWTVTIGGVERTWQARITEQQPDEAIAWQARGDLDHDRVTFHDLGGGRTRVEVLVQYQPEGAAERLADAVGLVRRRITQDLQGFMDFIEARPRATGSWRGRIATHASDQPGETGVSEVER